MGIRNILSVPVIFHMFNWFIGAPRSRSRLVRDYIRPKPGDKLVDIGCGMAEISAQMPGVDYFGFDISQEYIDKARRVHGDRIQLFNTEFTPNQAEMHGPFDLAIAVGVQHHLSDEQLLALLQTVQGALKPGGRFITIDGCYVAGQSRVARYILSQDRGDYVRDQAGYENIVKQVFKEYTSTIDHGRLNIPYTHIITESRKTA